MSPARMRVEGDTWELLIPVSPTPASRPRVGRWGVYYGKPYQLWMKTVDDLLRPLQASARTTRGPVRVRIHNVVRKPKTGKLLYPVGDWDNYAKAACDAVTRAEIIWEDDRQIIDGRAFKRYAEPGEEPHTLILVEQIGDSAGSDVFDLPPSARENYYEEAV